MNHNITNPQTQTDYEICLKEKKSFLGTLKSFFVSAFHHSEDVTRNTGNLLQKKLDDLSFDIERHHQLLNAIQNDHQALLKQNEKLIQENADLQDQLVSQEKAIQTLTLTLNCYKEDINDFKANLIQENEHIRARIIERFDDLANHLLKIKRQNEQQKVEADQRFAQIQNVLHNIESQSMSVINKRLSSIENAIQMIQKNTISADNYIEEIKQLESQFENLQTSLPDQILSVISQTKKDFEAAIIDVFGNDSISDIEISAHENHNDFSSSLDWNTSLQEDDDVPPSLQDDDLTPSAFETSNFDPDAIESSRNEALPSATEAITPSNSIDDLYDAIQKIEHSNPSPVTDETQATSTQMNRSTELDENTTTSTDNAKPYSASYRIKADNVQSNSELRVILPDGTVIQKNTQKATFVEAIRQANPAKVMALNIQSDKANLVSKHQYDLNRPDPVSDGYYVNTHSNGNQKKSFLEQISNQLHLGWKVEYDALQAKSNKEIQANLKSMRAARKAALDELFKSLDF